jgi:hypothetical protein
MIEKNEKINQRIFIFFPLLILFYISIIKTLNDASLQEYTSVVTILFVIQIVTHVILLVSGKSCTPKQNNICNKFAKIIGFIYLFIILLCNTKIKHKNIYFYFSLFVILYIILSHYITIYPIKGLLEYKDVSLNIFEINTYILIFSDLLNEVLGPTGTSVTPVRPPKQIIP